MMTTALGQTAGMPSEWSATIDRLAFGIQGQSDDPLELPANGADATELRPRLFVLAGGNIPWQDWDQYPSNNDLQTIEDPGQAWNALTVGAYTEQTQFNHETWPDLQPIAGHGALAPPRRTAQRLWPEILIDGGINEVGAAVDLRAKFSEMRENPTALKTWSGDDNSYKVWASRLDTVEYYLIKDMRIPLLIVHGELDRAGVPVESARELVRLLKQDGFSGLEYWEIPKMGHGIGNLEDPVRRKAILHAMFLWLFALPPGTGGPPSFGIATGSR